MTKRRMLSSLSATSLVLLSLVLTAPAAHANHITCGTILGPAFAGQTVTLDSNVGPCTTGFGILVDNADGLTLNLNGFSVIGSGVIAVPGNSEVGIYVFESDNVTIKNGTVTKWNSGIFLDSSQGGSGDTITGMRLIDNIGPDASGIFGEGLQIFFGGNHTVTNNQVIHNGPYSGINAYSSNNNNISSNQVTNNNIPSDEEHHGSGPLMQDIGIWIINLFPDAASFSHHNTVSSNSLSGNGLDGVQLSRFSWNNQVLLNNSSNNGFGQTPGIVIPARSPSCADGDGVANFGNLNQIRGNTTIHNGGNGIAVYRSGTPAQGQSNTITGNRSFQNGTAPSCVGKAFDLFDANLSPPCDANTWSGNAFGTRNQTCIN